MYAFHIKSPLYISSHLESLKYFCCSRLVVVVVVVVVVDGFVLFGRYKFYAHRIVCVVLYILKVSYCPFPRLLLFVKDD